MADAGLSDGIGDAERQRERENRSGAADGFGFEPASHGLNELEREREPEFEVSMGVTAHFRGAEELDEAGGGEVVAVITDANGKNQTAFRFQAIRGDGNGDFILHTGVDGMGEEGPDDLTEADGITGDDFRRADFGGFGEKLNEQAADFGAGMHGGDGCADDFMQVEWGLRKFQLSGHDGSVFECVA